MTLRRLAPILLVLAAAFAAPGLARAGAPVLFTDAAEGGNAPDITDIWVGNTAQYFTAWVTLANRPDGIGEQDVVTLYMDKDGLPGTGDPDHDGADRYVQAINLSGTLHAVFGVWTAGGWTTPPSPGVSAFWNDGSLRLQATLSELGDPGHEVHLALVAVWMGIVDYTDLAPGDPNGTYTYFMDSGTPGTGGPADTTAPTTRITSGPSGRRTLHRATFRFASNEKGSRFMCRLDSRPWHSCSSPKTYRGLKKGRHVFRVYAKDAAGNRDLTPALRRWRIA
jgi:hypothetical protein